MVKVIFDVYGFVKEDFIPFDTLQRYRENNITLRVPIDLPIAFSIEAEDRGPERYLGGDFLDFVYSHYDAERHVYYFILSEQMQKRRKFNMEKQLEKSRTKSGY